jgi:polyphosphate kinase
MVPMVQSLAKNLSETPAPLLGEEVSQREFLNRELSWLEFNRRVLYQAIDPRTPLLERVKFLGIFTSNLDEFFQKRVGGLKGQFEAGIVTPSSDGLSPEQQLAEIRKTVVELIQAQADCYLKDILPALRENGIHPLSWNQLTESERQFADKYFRQSVFPILTPLAVDPGHPFPFLSNLSESLGVILHHPDRGENLFARIKVPEQLPRWIQLPQDPNTASVFRFASLYDLIRHNLDDLFPDMALVDVMPFRVTRSADLELDEEDAEDLREMVQEEIRQRRFAKIVRLEHGPDPNPWILEFLMQELELSSADVYESPGELDYQDLKPISDLSLPKLRYEPWTPTVPPALADEDADIFSVIRSGGLLVHHPYESFNESVQRFIIAAANDPKVLAIKMTLYRTGDNSPFLNPLIRAAEANKQVVVLVELKARFDEARNILVAHELERAGVHVVYGIVGLKTHTKTSLVVRQDPDGIRCYAHVGTGNYHTQTARLYTDLGLFTCNPEITGDIVELFHYLTGRSLKRDYRKLLVAPVNMRKSFLDMIDREIENKLSGKPARIIAKMNSMEDRRVMRALYKASQTGVEIDLIIRGFCCLRPGAPGLSENIRVISVIGRLLEHSRIFYFQNGAADPVDGHFYIGSADWMYRNLQTRVEATVPIEDRGMRERLWEILQIMRNDRRQAWDMRPDGSYVQRKPESVADVGTQQMLTNLTRQRNTAVAVPARIGIARPSSYTMSQNGILDA